MSDTKLAYIDGIDWQHHVEDDAYGVKIYPSVAALKRGAGHSMEECGIVKIELREVEWVEPQNLRLGGQPITPPESEK